MKTYESLVRGEAGRFTIRVWRSESDAALINNDNIRGRIRSIHDSIQFDPDFKVSMRDIVDELSNIDRVAAVEVWDRRLNDTLIVYVDWPN